MLDFLNKVLFKKNKAPTRRDVLAALLTQTETEPVSLDREECYLLSNILKLHYVTADDVKVPRVEIKAVSRDVTLEELAAAVANLPTLSDVEKLIEQQIEVMKADRWASPLSLLPSFIAP